ncbi:outer membrane beta-barrel protein [Candidatus Binatus sp.]|uniref:outer membrane beta-barrel protein n=1 Tax=Candidatus Binatus sp. TaxID=2811406 RepID=UPI003BB17E9C
MNRTRTIRGVVWIRLVAGVALIGLLCTANARAEDPDPATTTTTTRRHHHHHVVTTTTTTTTEGPNEEQRLNALSGQVGNLQKQQDDTTSEVKKIEAAMVVAPPAANVAPVTIGQHVGQDETNIAAIQKNLTDNLGISVHALVDAGYEHNFNQPTANVNVFRAWDEDGFQLTQGNLHIERDGTVGFVTDINVGQVANSISGVTHYSNVVPVGGQWIDATQYYLTYTAPLGSGVSLEAGRFVTLLGAEIIPVYNNQNFNESRGLLFNLGEPLTHTGVRASYTFNDYVSATAGLNNGWDDPAANSNAGPNYEGELTLNNKDKSLSLVINGIWGPNAVPGPNGKQVSNSNLGAIDPIGTWKPSFVPNLTLQAEYLYASQEGPVINGHSASWQGAAGYVVYDFNPALESATRAEFFDDMDGARTDGEAQTLWEITQTISYKIPEVTGLIARLEYRHDNSSQNAFTNNNFINPVTGAQHLWHGQDTLAANFIYAF